MLGSAGFAFDESPSKSANIKAVNTIPSETSNDTNKQLTTPSAADDDGAPQSDARNKKADEDSSGGEDLDVPEVAVSVLSLGVLEKLSLQ